MTENLPRLHSLICLSADYDCAYIPHLIRHYGESVDSWIVLFHSIQHGVEGEKLIASATNQFENGLKITDATTDFSASHWFGEFNSYSKYERMNTLVDQYLRTGDWVLYMDADELIEPPYNGFKSLMTQCLASNQKVMYGCMIDRFAIDRKPLPIYDKDDLFIKFPVFEEFTKTKLMSLTHKPCLMAYEGNSLLLNCHDYSGFGWKDYLNSGMPVLKVWHFKWIDSTRDKLKYRVDTFKQQKIGWWYSSALSLKEIYPEKQMGTELFAASSRKPGTNPYKNQEKRGFWKTAFVDNEVKEVWRPKWPLQPQDQVATFGSCFARHLGPALRSRHFTWLETEQPPRGLLPKGIRQFGYGSFSCRTGPITTTTALLQWINWSLGFESPPDEYWIDKDRVIDPFRPSIEPGGFDSVEEMRTSRQVTLDAMRKAIYDADVFLFTLGMTESWVSESGGWVYPVCPGTVAGQFDLGEHRFVNLSFSQVLEALETVLKRLWTAKPKMKILLTVSPVPLTATATGDHVLSSTSYSKSTLRSVAGELMHYQSVDYFPSFELVSSPVHLYGKEMFESNRRSVSQSAIDHVMDEFFASQGNRCRQARKVSEVFDLDENLEDCEDAWAEAFVK